MQVLTLPDQEARLGPIAREHGADLQLLEPLTGSCSSSSSISDRGDKTSRGSNGSCGMSAEEVEATTEAVLADLRDLGQSDTTGSLIIYTSGTTGKPKGVLHTHRWVGGGVEWTEG